MLTASSPQPLLPGEKRQKEEWENIYVYGMTFNLLLIIAIATLKPDTRYIKEPPRIPCNCSNMRTLLLFDHNQVLTAI